MPDPTPELTEQDDAGTDVAPTTPPEPPAAPEPAKSPAKPKKAAAKKKDAPVLVPVSHYVRDAAHAVPLSGLLADQPELLEAELTVEAWDKKLDDYSKSER